MIVYLETSALLRWLLSEPTGAEVTNCLVRAERVVTPRLTIGETRRVLARLVSTGTLSHADDERARAEFEAQLPGWDVMEMTAEI